MKQAALIIAYQNIPHLIDLVSSLTDEFAFYIHIDKKSEISQSEINDLQSKENVILVSRKYKINWGGLNLTKAILFLAEEALKDKEIEYIHVLSGADFPIKNSSEIIEIVSRNKGREFIENFEMAGSTWENAGIDRLQYYHFTDLFNVKTFYGEKIVNLLLRLQRIFKFKRTLNKDFPKLYGGSTWWTLSSRCLQYVISYLKDNPNFLRRFKNTLIADEIIFQTIIMNSPFNSNVVNHNFRMILWKSDNDSHPAVLDETDYLALTESDKLFARKFDYPASEKLLHLLKENILLLKTKSDGARPLDLA